MKKLLFPLLGLALVSFLIGCDKDDDHGDNDVTIVFISPSAGEQVADASNVVLEIELTATEELHDTEIYLYEESNPDQPILEKDLHEHEKNYTFKQTVDLSSYPSGTVFILKAESCIDHDCDEQNEQSIMFSI